MSGRNSGWNLEFSSTFIVSAQKIQKRIQPCHEIIVLFILRKLILHMRMCSHPVGLDVWCLDGPFVNFHTSCVRTAKALARLRECAGSQEPSLVTCVISHTCDQTRFRRDLPILAPKYESRPTDQNSRYIWIPIFRFFQKLKLVFRSPQTLALSKFTTGRGNQTLLVFHNR